jgi:hypothetical protein
MTAEALKCLALVVTLAGLGLTATGAFFAARAVWLTDREAVDIGVSRFAGTYEENLALPAVRALLRQSHGASFGFWLIVGGTAMQAIGSAIGWWV